MILKLFDHNKVTMAQESSDDFSDIDTPPRRETGNDETGHLNEDDEFKYVLLFGVCMYDDGMLTYILMLCH